MNEGVEGISSIAPAVFISRRAAWSVAASAGRVSGGAVCSLTLLGIVRHPVVHGAERREEARGEGAAVAAD